ncbi:MAG: lamin tail domain-containing protein, partial [Flavobacterium sp.]
MKKIFILFMVLIGLSSCVKDEVFEGPAVIESITYLPKTVTTEDNVTVTAVVTDLIGIKSIKLNYVIDSETFSLEMKEAGKNTFTAVIPAQKAKTKVDFTVSVINTNNHTTLSKKQSYIVENATEIPAVIESINIAPQTVTEKDNATITAVITDLKGLKSVTLTYTINKVSTDLVMQLGAKDTYTAVIPKQENETQVDFIITVINLNDVKTASKKQSYTVGTAVTDYSKIILNEIDGNSKSVELYNNGTEAISLAGFKLLKNNADWWIGNEESGEIPAGGYVVIIQKNPDNPNLSGNAGISPKQSLKFELTDPKNASIGVFLRGDEA